MDHGSMSKVNEDAEEFVRAVQLNGGAILGMVIKAAIELDLFQIMAKASVVNGVSPFGDDAIKLSSHDIVAHFPTQNPAAAQAMLDRILRFLAAKSILNRTQVSSAGDVVDGKDNKSLYSLASICKHYIPDEEEDGVSLAALSIMLHDKVVIDSWYKLKDAVLEGGVPFDMAHGMNAFEYPAKDSRFNYVFNEAMYNHTTMTMKKLLQVYTGFKTITEIIDVGGGTGATLAKIISEYPHITRGINFDLPHVVNDAAPIPGVEHVGGDMFESVPKGEVIFMKWILHDWSDEHCLKLLKNCCDALPEFGKVIIVESVVPEYSDTAAGSSSSTLSAVTDNDMVMLALNPGGKERTMKEFEALAKESGFAAVKLICSVAIYSVLEFHKQTA